MKLIDQQIIAYAKQMRIRDIEIDDNAEVSRTDDGRGAFVQAWIYVDLDDIRVFSSEET